MTEIQEHLHEAWAAETAADLSEIFQIHYGMPAVDAAHAVSQLEDRGLIEINCAVQDGPISFTLRGLRALGL